MLRWIISFSLQFRFLVLAAASAMVAYGIVGVGKMPIDVFPEFSPPLVEIQTEGLGMNPQEVEEIITIPMEQALRGTPKLDILRSKSVDGLSAIQLLFKPETDILEARQLVQERLVLTKDLLPALACPVMLQPLSATSRVMKIGIKSNTTNLLDMSMTAYWKLRFRIMQVPGVANVAIWGERIKALVVQADPQRMTAHNVTLDDVLETTAGALDNGLLPYESSAKTRIDGFIDTPNQRLEMTHLLPVMEPADLAMVPVGKLGVTLGDVANVKWDTPLLIGDAVIDDGEGLMLIVEKFPWANTLQVTRGVEAAIDAMRPGLPELSIDTTIFRPATFIENSIYNLNKSLVIGCFLVVVILFVFLYEWRIALISCTAIPLSIMAAVVVLYLRETTVNTMVLAGFVIALGAVVDDAIVDIENIVRRIRQYRREGSNKSTASIILNASLEVRNAIVYSSLIEVLALLPVLFLAGLSGAFFKPLAISYMLAIGASTVVALTVTPALGLILLKNAPLEKTDPPVMRWLQALYVRFLSRIVNRPRAAYVIVACLALVGGLLVPRLGQELLPSFKERDFLMHWLTKPGSSHEENWRVTAKVSKELREIPGVRNFGAHIGRALVADEVVGMNFTENWISVDPSVPYDETVHAVEDLVSSYPGIYSDVQTYLKERIREVLSGGGHALVIRIFGPDLHALRTTAEGVKTALTGIEGLPDLHTEMQIDVPHIQITVKEDVAASYGLKPGDIRRASGTIVSGVEVADIYRDSKVYDVMVWTAPEVRSSVDNIKAIMLDTPGGKRVRLDEVADIQILPTPNIIKREAQSRRIDVSSDVKGRDLGEVAKEVQAKLDAYPFPVGYHAEVLGEYVERQKSQERLVSVAMVSVLGILLLLQTSFRNWALSALGFLALPAALVGGVFAVYISSGVVSLGTLVGFLTILGIAARNGIMLINHYQHLEEVEGEVFGPALVIRGAKERLAPILMTALTTGLALVPLVYAGNIPGHEIELPTAIVILGGLFTSTTLNLLVIPSLYLRFGGGKR